MIILADENIDHRIIIALESSGFNVYSIYFSNRGLSDLQIAELSLNPPKIILTEDKDFGELVFKRGIKNISVIFLRYPFKNVLGIIDKLLIFLNQHPQSLFGHFTTITINKTRSRKV